MEVSVLISSDVVRDPKYYFPDGNTIILVENTLFNVHRSILCQDQSAFEGMFLCPTGMWPGEGETDDNPIRLQGDTLEQVRALMWSLYALPHERRNINDSNGLHRSCLLARIAHKYHFQSVETWALETLSEVFVHPWTGASMSELMETTNIAFLCQHARLIKLVTSAWMEVVRSASSPSKIMDLSIAISVSEQRGLSCVRGRAYYAMMVMGRGFWEQDGVLNRPQRLRLLSGFHDLANRCSYLSTQYTPVITHSACNSPYMAFGRQFSPEGQGCRSGWLHLWKNLFRQQPLQDAFGVMSPADLAGRLSYIAKHLQYFHDAILASTSWPMAPPCLQSAIVAITAMSEDCLRGTAKLFVDPK